MDLPSPSANGGPSASSDAIIHGGSSKVRVCCPPQTLSEVSPFQRDRVAAQLMQPGYVRKLLELFSVRRVT